MQRSRLLSWIGGEYPDEAADRRRRPGHRPARRRRSSARSCASSSRPRSRTSRPRPTRSCREALVEGRVGRTCRRRTPAARRRPRSTRRDARGDGRRDGRGGRWPNRGRGRGDAATRRRRRRRRGRAPPSDAEPTPATADEAATARLTGAGRYPAAMPDRLPPPGPSFLREHAGPHRRPHAARRDEPARPRRPTAGGWPSCGSPTTTASSASATSRRRPVHRPIRRSPGSVRPSAGALSGLILEDDGRLQMRLGLIAPPDDATRPWRAPLAIRAAFRFEPARAAAMRPNELAETVLAGVPARRREASHRP